MDLSRLAFSVFVLASPVMINGNLLAAKPDLAIRSISVSYQAGGSRPQQCTGSQVVATFDIRVANIGPADSPAVNDLNAVLVKDPKLGDWTGGAALPAIAHGKEIVVSVPLRAYRDGPSMIGSRSVAIGVNAKPWFPEISMANNTASASITIPDGYCGYHAKNAMLSKTLSAGHGVQPVVIPMPTKPPQGGTAALHNLPNLAAPTIAAPSGLGQSPTVQDCTSHVGLAGAFICPAIIQDAAAGNELPLVWNWNPCGGPNCAQRIDGFKVYAVKCTMALVRDEGSIAKDTGDLGGIFLLPSAFLGSESKMRNTTANAQSVHTITCARQLLGSPSPVNTTFFAVQKPGQYAYQGYCYAVRAYAGANESSDSNQNCGRAHGGVAVGPQYMTLQPTQLAYSWTRVEVDEQYCQQPSPPISLYLQRGTYGGIVGNYVMLQTPSQQCNNSIANGAGYFARTAFIFDLSALQGKAIISATLSTGWSVPVNFYATGQPKPRCDRGLMLGMASTNWLGGFDASKPIPEDDFVGLNNYATQDVDVSNQVRRWLTNAPNYGFVIRGNVEDQPAFIRETAGVCLDAVTGMQLYVSYT